VEFSETNSNGGSITSINFDNTLSTTGNGFSFQLGGIMKLSPEFRVGVTYDSPTWYSIDDETTQYLDTNELLSQNENLLKRFSFTQLFLFSTIVFALRWFLNIYVTSVFGFFMVTSLHGIAFGIVYPTAINYISRYLNEDINATAIALINTTYLITFSILSSMIGVVYKNFSFDAVMYVYLAIAAVSFVFVALFHKFKSTKEVQSNIFETDRLFVRSFQEYDMKDFMKYRNNLEWMKYQGFKGLKKEEYINALVKPFDINNHSQVAIILKAKNVVIGDLYLKKTNNSIHVGYTINPDYARKGYTFEATLGVIDYLKEMYPECTIESGVDIENIPSIRLLEKLGFLRTNEENGEYHYILKGTTM
jgi:RimJ/RimL family protein N-acetyltransferase